MYASRISRLTGSVAREILSHANNRNMISFAGGLPAPEAFGSLELSVADDDSFQYGSSEGEKSLRECFAKRFQGKGISCDYSQVLITSGAQQGIDLVSKLFVEEGSKVVVEKPTYLAAIQSFSLFGAEFESIDLDPDGINLDELERVFQSGEIRFIYLGPSFQNPSGICYSVDKRKAVAALLDKYDVILVEDDPYSELNYSGCETVPICSYLKTAKWIYLSTVSKILAPGLRLGSLVCSEEFFPYLLKLKQAADLHSNRFSQIQVLKWLEDESTLNGRILDLRTLYCEKRDKMKEALDSQFTGIADWEIPAGGLFFWVKIHGDVSTRELLKKTLERGVAFMPGSPFFATAQEGEGYMRLNFSNPAFDEISSGMKILSEELENFC